MFSAQALGASIARELGEALIDAAEEVEQHDGTSTREDIKVYIEWFDQKLIALPVGFDSDDPVIAVTGG